MLSGTGKLIALRPAFALVLLAGAVQSSADDGSEALENDAKRSVYLNAIAVGFDKRYGCENFDPGSSGSAISVADTESEQVTLSVACAGGPTASTRINVRDNQFHEPIYRVDIDHETSIDAHTDSGVEQPDHLRRQIVADPFIQIVYPALASLVNARCENLDNGEFHNRWPGEEQYLLEKDRVYFILRCTAPGATHSFEFAGLYDAHDDVIDWYSISKGWSGY